MKYELTSTEPEVIGLVGSLVALGYLRKVEEHPGNVIRQYEKMDYSPRSPVKQEDIVYSHASTYVGGLKIEPEDNIPCSSGAERFLNNHTPIETNVETIAKENLGIVEDRKQWIKELKAAVKEYGHDVILETFYDWTMTQSGFMGKRPVSFFLKNVGSHIGVLGHKPTVTNPALDRIEQKIAYVSDNRVFFTGEYRVRLAGLLKNYGDELVFEAFSDFFQDVEERNKQWAARNFLERADVMIQIIVKKRQEVLAQENLLAATLQQAQESVEEVDEEEEL